MLGVLCFDNLRRGGGGFSASLAEQMVLEQNLSQSSPLLGMKLVISRKAWYVTTWLRGMVDDDVDGDGAD